MHRLSESARSNFYYTVILFSETGPGCVAQASLELAYGNSCLSFPAAGNTTYPAQYFTLQRAKGASWSKNLDIKILLPILKMNIHYKLYLKYVTFWGDVNKSKG